MKNKNSEPCYLEIRLWPFLPKLFPACLGVWIIVLMGLLSFGFQYADETFLIFFFGVPLLAAMWAAGKSSIRFYKTYFEKNPKERVYFANIKNVEFIQDGGVWFLRFTLDNELFYFISFGHQKNEKILQLIQELLAAYRENRSPKILPQQNHKV